LKKGKAKLQEKAMSLELKNTRLPQLFSLLEQQGPTAFICYAIGLEYKKHLQYAEACDWFKKTILIDANDLAAHYQLAQGLAENGHETEALTVYDQGIAIAEKLNDLKTLAELKNARLNLELEL